MENLPDPEPQLDAKRPSKQEEVIAMLRRPEGVTVDEVASVTGCSAIPCAASSRNPKRSSATLASAMEERGRVYRIVKA